jgi:hypothetical protein
MKMSEAEKRWNYYQALVKESGFEGITDLLAKHKALQQKVIQLTTDLLASQASEARLRQVLCYWREECTGFEPSISVFALKVDEALSQSTNTDELESFVAKAVESEIDKRLGEPELYMAKNLHNKSYATSFSEPEARLFLLQSGLKVDGVESKVIPLYTKKG